MRSVLVVAWLLILVGRAGAQPDPDALVTTPHRGPVLAAGLGIGLGGELDLRAGWMLTPRLAMFAIATQNVNDGEDDVNGSRMLGGGARLWLFNRVFVDAALGYSRSELYGIPPREDLPQYAYGTGGLVGLGVEILRCRYAGLEWHADFVEGAGRVASLTTGLRLAFY